MTTPDPTIWFGRPGSLVELPHPRGGLRATRDRPTSVFRTGSGGARLGRSLSGKRQFTLDWESLDYETFTVVAAFNDGHEGPGPFALLDPGQRNWLTVNQSAATSHTNGADNFTVSGSGHALESDSVTYRRGPRSLKWSAAYANQTGTLTLDAAATEWPGVPVALGRPVVFAFQAKGGGSDPVVTLTPTLTWYAADGSTLSTDSGNATPTTSADWTQMYVTASPPATAAYVGCSVAASAGTISAGAAMYLDELQLEEGSTPSDWRPGAGVWPVQVVSLPDEWPFYQIGYRRGPALVLQELGA